MGTLNPLYGVWDDQLHSRLVLTFPRIAPLLCVPVGTGLILTHIAQGFQS